MGWKGNLEKHMNSKLKAGLFKKIYLKLDYHKRLLDLSKNRKAFYDGIVGKYISTIYIINLDRSANRWNSIKKELKRIRINNSSLYSISRRFSAVDARYLENELDQNLIQPYYKLSDQFKIEPNENYEVNNKNEDKVIKMTSQEIAVTLSHIGVWKKIQDGGMQFSLVLEDDVYFSYGFAKTLDKIWTIIEENEEFDILFLSYEYAKGSKKNNDNKHSLVHKPDGGIWQASGYVLSKKGVNKLLNLLPVYGPVDLWLNLQFNKLNVLYSEKIIIKQRADIASSNSYSIMPIFTQLGLYNDTKPLIMKKKRKLPLVMAYGEKGSGISALELALSMIGYTCCSDLEKYTDKFNSGKFNAFINVGKYNPEEILDKFNENRNLHIIVTSDCYDINRIVKENIPVLYLEKEIQDKWQLISQFLKVDYPSFNYPSIEDKNPLQYKLILEKKEKVINRKFDELPWIIDIDGWHGIEVLDSDSTVQRNLNIYEKDNQGYNEYFYKRSDTFSGNLALFQKENVRLKENVKLICKEENMSVRAFSSGAIASKKIFSNGIYSAYIKPACVPGVITGMFLHRNSPHQEIDIEFLGNNSHGILVNVFYNPGEEGTKLEYGYRGTPTWIPLDFDVSKDFHKYEIVWNRHSIEWKVDDLCVYKRNMWDPTPIPNLPMEFNINLWISNSSELAGELEKNRLPVYSEIKGIEINYVDIY